MEASRNSLSRFSAFSTPFVRGGKRAVRRKWARERRQVLGGSGAYTRRPVRIRLTTLAKWQRVNLPKWVNLQLPCRKEQGVVCFLGQGRTSLA
jgi:hypothetical protein